jgi:hypothetical protein
MSPTNENAAETCVCCVLIDGKEYMNKFLIPALLAALPFVASAADSMSVTAVNKLPIARARQTIELTVAQLAPLGETNLNKIHVKDAAGQELIVQAVDTDFDDYHRPDIVIFQSDFAPNETRTFTVTSGKVQMFKPEDYRAYGRFVRERFDDFAWENDLIAHRTYGKALETWKGEPLTSSAIDIWSKLHPGLILNEWYMMGDTFYHRLNSNGGDDYSAGATRGDGGNGLWAADNQLSPSPPSTPLTPKPKSGEGGGREGGEGQFRLWVSKNFVMSRELAGGPIRVMFELDYEPFDVNGRQVAETMRVTLDAGSQMDHYQVTFKPVANGAPLTAAVGLKLVRNEQVNFNAARGTLAIWEPMEGNWGMQGVAAIVDPKRLERMTVDRLNDLLLVGAPDNKVDYWAGFAWDKAGKITTADGWKKYVDEFAQGVQSPIEITVSAGQ